MNAGSDGAEILVVCGPTAAGKSSLALDLAQREPSVIISADSRQVYRGFDVGTAKPTAKERALVPHEGLDVADPETRYSAAAWATAADRWIDAALGAGRRPIVVGGTGLYLRALFEGLFEEPALDLERRNALESQLATYSTDSLRKWVDQLDPPRAHLGRTQLLRSIQIALLTGRRLSDLHRERPRKPRWRPRYLVVDPGPPLGERIARRIDDMLEHGWADEVQRLMQTIPSDAPAWNSTGYGAVRQMLDGALSRTALHEKVLIDTRQYAKRQRTWFRHQLPDDLTTRVDPTGDDCAAIVDAWSKGGKLA
ncbi:MAG TPA: tRNA (adenosine(37)-N6)-dimethylallyltransferase MiaA [Gemmatimonadaceae bacterium]